MITLRKGRSMACLTLLLNVCALAGPVQTSRADVASTPPKAQTFAEPARPVVKIDRAMLEERETLPDGMVHTGTFFDAAPTQSAKNAPKMTVGSVNMKA